MNYFVSETILYFDIALLDKYQEPMLKFLKENFIFGGSDFDNFILVLQFTPKDRVGKFGPDRLQVSKKERTLFLGVNMVNEIFTPNNSIVDSELNYIFNRILTVKEQNISRLKSNGLIG